MFSASSSISISLELNLDGQFTFFKWPTQRKFDSGRGALLNCARVNTSDRIGMILRDGITSFTNAAGAALASLLQFLNFSGNSLLQSVRARGSIRP